MKNRIYGEKVSIPQEVVKEFWTKRASMFAEKGISTVICGDQVAERALQETAFDRDHIIPKLGITKESRVLDIGCGVGRVAKMLLPQCGFYCGVDYTEEMIKVSETVCAQTKKEFPEAGEYELHHLSFPETVQQKAGLLGGPFDVCVILGVCVYMNDEELEQSLRHLPDLMSDHAVLWFQESVGLKERLTLDRFPSEALQTGYTSIYRTKEEYMELYAPLFKAGFSFVEEAPFPDFGNPYEDSGRWYGILKRG